MSVAGGSEWAGGMQRGEECDGGQECEQVQCVLAWGQLHWRGLGLATWSREIVKCPVCGCGHCRCEMLKRGAIENPVKSAAWWAGWCVGWCGRE